MVPTSYFVSEIRAGENYVYHRLGKDCDFTCWRRKDEYDIDPEDYQFEDYYKVMFTTEEKAQAYCDWLNKEQR